MMDVIARVEKKLLENADVLIAFIYYILFIINVKDLSV